MALMGSKPARIAHRLTISSFPRRRESKGGFLNPAWRVQRADGFPLSHARSKKHLGKRGRIRGESLFDAPAPWRFCNGCKKLTLCHAPHVIMAITIIATLA